MTNEEMAKASELAQKVKDQFYKYNVKADDIVKALQSDKALKLDAAGAKKFVYVTLGMGHLLKGEKK
jgi:hypothetical protein